MLASWRRDATGLALAQRIFEGIDRLGDNQRSAFFHALAEGCSVDREGPQQAIAVWMEDSAARSCCAAASNLRISAAATLPGRLNP